MDYYYQQDQQDFPDLTAAELATAYDELAEQWIRRAQDAPYYAGGARKEYYRQAQDCRKAAKFYRKQAK